MKKITINLCDLLYKELLLLTDIEPDSDKSVIECVIIELIEGFVDDNSWEKTRT